MATPHISCEKGDIAKTVLMPGDPLRAKMIAEKFLENPRLVNEVRGMLAYTGTYKSKYYDVYLASQFTGYSYTNMTFCTLSTCGGQALYETGGWYNDSALFADSEKPWFVRGGASYNDQGAFNSYQNSGIVGVTRTWHSVLVAR